MYVDCDSGVGGKEPSGRKNMGHPEQIPAHVSLRIG